MGGGGIFGYGIFIFSTQVVIIVKNIEDRLQGKYPKSKGLPLSVEEQVHALIKVPCNIRQFTKYVPRIQRYSFTLPYTAESQVTCVQARESAQLLIISARYYIDTQELKVDSSYPLQRLYNGWENLWFQVSPYFLPLHQ